MVIINIATNEVLHEDSYEYNGVIARCGGNTHVEAPQPNAQEIALQQEQLDIMKEERAEYKTLEPILLQSMGLVAEADGTYRRMTTEEQTSYMTDTEKLAQEALNLTYERQLKALKGELDISPALEDELTTQKTKLMENLSQRLGSGWETTTAGIQAMGEFDKNAEMVREEARRGIISQSTGLATAQAGYLTSADLSKQSSLYAYGGRLGNLFNQYGQAQQPYQYYSGLQNQANIANAQMASQQTSGLMSGLGTLAGMGAYALLTPSSKDYKKDIKKLSDEDALDMVLDTDIYTYHYKGEGSKTPRHTGVIAEKAPDAITTPGKKMVNLGNQLGLLQAATRALAKKVEGGKHA